MEQTTRSIAPAHEAAATCARTLLETRHRWTLSADVSGQVLVVDDGDCIRREVATILEHEGVTPRHACINN